MTRTPKAEQYELRRIVKEAISNGIIIPNDIRSYIMDNGWEYNPPAQPTIIDILGDNNIFYVHGKWAEACSCKRPGFAVGNPEICPTCGRKHRKDVT